MLVVGTGRRDAPAVPLFHHDGSAVVEDAAAQIDRRIVLHQVRVHGVASGEDAARDEHDVPDLQRPDLFVRDGRLECDLPARAGKTGRGGFGGKERLRKA